ncbi:MAG: hypothetical protein KDK91_30875 [Gammaproteobacteria bacterium]|nr:hypothetical protein [Gammaproteobacteria bacterium]
MITLERKIDFLSRADSYPESTTSVRRIETHMSYVFVTDHFAYKMKKPVKMPFLDFTDLAQRKHYCEESLRLNRRLAATVYLGLIALTRGADGTLCLGGTGEPVEWLEKMRRLSDELMLDRALAEHRVSAAEVVRIAGVLIHFYERAEPAETDTDAYRARLERNVEDYWQSLDEPAYRLDTRLLDETLRAQLRLLRTEPRLFDERVESGRVIEAHGDLRPEHVCLTPTPVIVDCLEFNREFRILDCVDELCFLALECELAGESWVGDTLLCSYASQTGDRTPQRLRAFYKSHRAILRARLAAWHIQDHGPEEHPKWLARATRYLEVAADHARRF